MTCHTSNPAEAPTIWSLVHLLTKGQQPSAFEILLDIDGSHRTHRHTFQFSDIRNAATELVLLNRRTDANLLIESAEHCPHDVVSVLLACTQNNDRDVLSPSARLSAFEIPSFGCTQVALSPLAGQLWGGNVLKEDLLDFSSPQRGSVSSLHSPSVRSPGAANARIAESYVHKKPTFPPNMDRLSLNFTRQGETAMYRLSEHVLEMCVSGTRVLGAHSNDVYDRWVHSHDCGEVYSIMNQSMAHGDAYSKLTDIVDKTDVKDGIMAAIICHITSILHGYVNSLTTASNHMQRNDCFITLNKSEEWAEQMTQLLAVCNKASSHDTRSVVRRILVRPGRYYDSHAVDEMANTVLSMCFRELDLAVTRPSLPVASSVFTLFGDKHWHDKVNFGDAAIIGNEALSDLLDSSALSALQRVLHSRTLLSHLGEDDGGWTLPQDHGTPKCKRRATFFDEDVTEEPLSNALFEIARKGTCNIPSVPESTSGKCREGEICLHLNPDRATETSCSELEALSRQLPAARANSQTLFIKRKIAEYEDLDEKFQARLMHIFTSKLKVYQHLNNLFFIALLGAGNFADALVSQLNAASALCEKNEKFLSLRGKGSLTFVSTADPIGKLRRLNLHLQKSLNTALNLSFAQDNMGTNMGLSSDVELCGNKSLWSARMHFHYRVDYPLNVVLTNACIQTYSLLFNFFLKLRRATNGIHSLFILTRRISSVLPRTNNYASVQRTRTPLWYFCWEAQHFLYEVREKTMRVVLERFSNRKGDLWANVDTVWELKSRLEHLLHWSLDTCFLSPEHQSLLGVLTVGFQIIISIEENLHESNTSSRSSHDVEDMLKSATFSLKRRIRFFRDMLHRMGPSIHSHGK